MASRTITPEQFEAAITEILQEYDLQVPEQVLEAVTLVSKQGANLVKSNSGMFGGTGKYRGGWTSTIEPSRMSAKGTVHNSRVPGLPHLLEFGHATRNGKRVDGRTHIAPVEQQIIAQFEAELERRLSQA